MSERLVLAIVGLVGLGVGIWLGLPGRERQSVEDIERAMDAGGSDTTRKRLAKRSLNPLAWMQRKAPTKPSRAGRGPRRRGFNLESPDDR
jgi:hypothetical protein